MYGLNAVALIFFCGINILAYQLSKQPMVQSQRVVRGLSAVLLLGNLFRYLFFYPVVCKTVQIPVDRCRRYNLSCPSAVGCLYFHVLPWRDLRLRPCYHRKQPSA